MDNIVLNVYDDDENIIKTCVATEFTIKFGTIRSLMKLLNVDNLEDTAELLNVVYKAWTELTDILSKCFPDMEDSDWDRIDIKELIPVLFKILRSVGQSMLTIPSEKN